MKILHQSHVSHKKTKREATFFFGSATASTEAIKVKSNERQR